MSTITSTIVPAATIPESAHAAGTPDHALRRALRSGRVVFGGSSLLIVLSLVTFRGRRARELVYYMHRTRPEPDAAG